jgi:hypothetical protein
LWISELGEIDLLTGDYISEQPYLGSMFTSQNNTTWTPEQLKDVKFRINRCQFDEEGTVQINLEPFAGIKEAASFTPNFQPMIPSGTSMDMDVILNGDTTNMISGILDNEEVVLEDVISLDGSQTIASGYQYTPISYNLTMRSSNPNISPVINKERLSTIVIDNIIWDTAPEIAGPTPEKNQMGVYLSKDVKLANMASDLQMFLSIQELHQTYVKVYYDTGSVIPRTIEVRANIYNMGANLVSHGDYNVNDYEEQYAYIYPGGTYSPEAIVTNQGAGIGAWNGIIAAPGMGPSSQVSTAYVDGDDDEANLWIMSLADISDMNEIVNGCWISSEDLQGVSADTSSAPGSIDGWWPAGTGTDLDEYEVGDVWFGNFDSQFDRIFYKKILGPDGIASKEVVPVLEVITSVVEQESIMWREMKDGGLDIANTSFDTSLEFIEHTFTPLKKIVKEFDHFRVKIELHTTHRCALPAIREMRVLAVT